MPEGAKAGHIASARDYRPDIDGLRAIAVLAVVFFHADINLFRGGFIGVDVFFVISGFLITRIILRETEAARANEVQFDYLNFYVRRARRLFPALFVTTAITFCAAALLLVPAHFERFSGALLSSLVWLSNVFFWTEAGYFDSEAHLKPLLHTWSLSVEEQFYLIWPAFLVVLAKFGQHRWVFIGIAAISVLSLLGAELMHRSDSSGAFFLMPFRIYEFGLGGLLVWFSERLPKKDWVLEGILLTGFVLIGASFLAFRESSIVPGWLGLIPCLGAACIIYAGRAPRLGKLISNAAAVYIGRISYSLYLVHWPIVVLYRYREEEFTLVDKAIVVSAAVITAVALHHLVEDRLRKPKVPNTKPRRFVAGALAASIVLALPAIHAFYTAGWGWRWDVPQPILDVVGNFKDVRDATWQHVRNSRFNNQDTFDSHAKEHTTIFLVGDSHSKDMFNAFHLNKDLNPKFQVRQAGLPVWCLWRLSGAAPPKKQSPAYQKRCRDQTKSLLETKALAQADWVMLSFRWRDNSDEFLGGALKNIREHSQGRLAVFGRTAEFPDVPLLALDHGTLDGLGELATKQRKTALDEINARLAVAAIANEAVFIDKLVWVCGQSSNECVVTDENDQLLIFDVGHWTLAGAKYYGQRMFESGALSALEEK